MSAEDKQPTARAKVAIMRPAYQMYDIDCAYCGIEIGNPSDGSLLWCSDQSYGQTFTCYHCKKVNIIPKALRST